MKQFKGKLTLTVAGPFLVGGTGIDVYGVDMAFHRDWQRERTVPASQLKGALRSALCELRQFSDDEIDDLFGRASGDVLDGDYRPYRGRLDFTDMVCDDAQLADTRRHRVRMDSTTGTAAHRMLRTVEHAYGSDSEVACNGAIYLWAEDLEAAREIMNKLYCGLRWITALGGQRSVGYGVLRRVELTQPQELESSEQGETCDQGFQLEITAEEAIMVGGVKLPKSNITISESVLPGGLIKGALAASMNRAFGRQPFMPLNGSCADKYPGYEQLVTHFGALRITHAFPGHADSIRPVRVPYSTAEDGDGQLVDAALWSDKDTPPLKNGRPLAYEPDWKTSGYYLCGVSPPLVAFTRTKIHPATRRAEESQLFTELALSPEKDNERITWRCAVEATLEDTAIEKAVLSQAQRAISAYLRRLGKRNSLVRVQIRPEQHQAADGQTLRDGLAIIVLQTNAVMLNPKDVRALPVDQDLEGFYAAYWQEISKNSLALDDFWAKQTFRGGYLYHRYLGADDQPKHYYPYYLTEAGSTFRLKVIDETEAKKWIAAWQKGGLPLPSWATGATGAYARPNRDLWQTCPFVPENGYGEIAVNLDWHWNRRIDAPAMPDEPTTNEENEA